MSDRLNIQPVGSGVPYRVTSVAGHVPERLEDFVADGAVTVTVSCAGADIDIVGPVVVAGHHAVLYEKDGAGTGKDIRKWHIHHDGGGFQAMEAGIY